MIEVMGSPYEDPRLANVYERGNAMPASSLRSWVELITSFSGVARPAIVDVGAGTGMFASAFADMSSPTAVVGVDPSVAMLRNAQLGSGHGAVHYVAGDAAALPLRDGRFDLAVLSRVVHHLPSRERCAVELKRVLRQRGAVVVRTTVREHLDALVYEYWPRLLEVDRERFPSLENIIVDFEGAGFDTVAVKSFAQPVHANLTAYHEAMRLRPQSKFGLLSGQEFADGLATLERDASLHTMAEEVAERYDVLVFSSR